MCTGATPKSFVFILTGRMENVRSKTCASSNARCCWSGTSQSNPNRRSFALVRLAKDQPITVMPARVVGGFPFRRNNWSLANLHDAIAGTESSSGRYFDDFDMGPLESVSVNVVSNLAEENPFRLEHPVCLLEEGRIQVGEVVAVAGRRFQDQAKAD